MAIQADDEQDYKTEVGKIDWHKFAQRAQQQMNSVLTTSTKALNNSLLPHAHTQALGGSNYSGYPYQFPTTPGPTTFEELLGMTEEQKSYQKLMAQLQAQIAIAKDMEKQRLASMSKQDLAREALQEVQRINQRLDTLTAALTTICLESDQPVDDGA